MSVRIAVFSAAAAALIAVAGCAPISPDFATTEAPASTGGTVPAAAAEAAATLDPNEGAIATVTTPSLRVRSTPSGTGALLGALKSGEQYRVLSRSSDGGWLELAIPQLARGSGWVSASLVSVNGDITDTPISAVPEAAPAAASTPEATAAPAQEPTAVPTEEPTAVPTEEPTAVPTEEPTAVPTEEPTAVPTEEPTAVPTEEPTAVPTEEPTPTPAALVLPTATPRPTDAPVEQATTEATATPAPEIAAPTPAYTAPAAGFAIVIAEPRLRVRAAPTTDAEIVGYGYPGELFQVLGTSADGLWTQIAGSADAAENPAGGWVSTEFLLLGQ